MNKSSESDFEELLFWGRIEGASADYYICMGVTFTDKYEFPEKRFFWASSRDFKFQPFPTDLNSQHMTKVDDIKDMFSGDPKSVLIRVEPEAVAEGEEGAGAASEEAPKKEDEKDPLASTEEEDPATKIKPLNFTELHRLHYTVLAIENDCHIIPKGSIVMVPSHEMRRNHAFSGLNMTDAFDIKNYSFFKNVKDKCKRAALMQETAVINMNLLEDVSDCKTDGAWSVVRSGKPVAIIRNLEWPGFTAYHKVNSREHGTFYIGDGLRDEGLTFKI